MVGPRDHLWSEPQGSVDDFSNACFLAMDWVGVDAADEEPEAFCTIVDRFIRRMQAESQTVRLPIRVGLARFFFAWYFC